MQIYNLADRMEYFDAVVDLVFGEWGTHGEKNNRAYWESWIKSSLSQTDIPQTYVAIENTILLATFSLWRRDLQSRQDLFPWFGGLYVTPQYRHAGIGKIMKNVLSAWSAEELIEYITYLKKCRAVTREDRLKLQILDQLDFTIWACDDNFKVKLWKGISKKYTERAS